MKKIIYILLFFMLISSAVFAQHETNRQVLEQITIEQEALWKQANEKAKKYAAENNIELRKEFEDGRIVELVDVVNGLPVYYTTDNLGAAKTTRASELWENPNFGGGLTGLGFDKVAVWDGGSARVTHDEFNNTGEARVVLGDEANVSAHSTHVVGTIIAGGVKPNAKGMANEAFLKSYDWNNVNSEMSVAVSQGYLISNHSWGRITGWNYEGGWTWTGDPTVDPNEDYMFGYYSQDARTWDLICYNSPNFLVVKSAGNDRGEGPNNAGSSGVPEKDGGADGYDCISDRGTAKNILTVGAVRKVLSYSGPSSVTMSYFSGWGPTDDGRIKPDIVAAGVDVYSCSSGSNTSYTTMDGTSMSAPNVTGSLILLQQYYQQLYGEPMRSATVKGLAIHTAEECGSSEGPDYRFGWGLLNVEKAAELIKADADINTIDELTLQNGETYERKLNVISGEPLRVTICWTDPHGPSLPAALNDRTPVLINDLDLKVIDEANNTYYPYKLDPNNPAAPATKNSTNDVDNVEHIYIENPVDGEYTIVITHKETLQNNSQVFSLITSCSTIPFSSDATLIDLTVNPGTLEPEFTPENTNYNVTVPYEITTIDIIGTANDSNATVEGNVTGAELIVGDNPFDIIVTAENGVTTETYSVNVVREDPIYYTIISSVNGENGTIEPEGTHQYLKGESVTYYMKPNKEYKIDEVFVDGSNIGSDSTYIFTDINSDHEIVVSFVSLSSIKEYDEQTMKIYPNPAEDYITIESEEIINEIVIFNSTGKKIFEVNNIKENLYEVDLNNYTTGIYYIKINGITKKLIVM